MTQAQTRCLLLGAAGQLGFDLARTHELGGELIRLTRADLDLCDAVVAGGADTLAPLTVRGFSALEAVASDVQRVYREKLQATLLPELRVARLLARVLYDFPRVRAALEHVRKELLP